eukprot:1156751-Pelagomonas_calceolata.AAC.5
MHFAAAKCRIKTHKPSALLSIMQVQKSAKRARNLMPLPKQASHRVAQRRGEGRGQEECLGVGAVRAKAGEQRPACCCTAAVRARGAQAAQEGLQTMRSRRRAAPAAAVPAIAAAAAVAEQ